MQASWPIVEAEWRKGNDLLTALKLSLERYELNQGLRAELEALVPKVEQALKECVEERQKFIDGILSEIAQDVGKLYEAVHPGEGLDKIALPLDPARRASMELKAQFAGQEAPPQAYFSQSHLDTLPDYASSSRWPSATARPRRSLILMTCWGVSMNPMSSALSGWSSRGKHEVPVTHNRHDPLSAMAREVSMGLGEAGSPLPVHRTRQLGSGRGNPQHSNSAGDRPPQGPVGCEPR